MGKLYETFAKIDGGRKKCIDSLNNMGVSTSSDATFDSISNNIMKVNIDAIDITKKEHMWQRPEEWIDTEEVLRNAPKIDGYTPFALYLLQDNRPNIELTLTRLGSGYNSIYAHAYYMSDGSFLTHESTNSETKVTHTWDTTKDIVTGLHYNLRYVIAYVWDTLLSSTVSYIEFGKTSGLTAIGDSLLELVGGNLNDNRTDNRLNIPARTDGILNVQRIHTLDYMFSIRVPSSAYNSVREIQIDYAGQYNFGKVPYEFFYYQDYRRNNQASSIKLILPNITKMTSSYGNSSASIFPCYVYAPKLTNLTINSYGTWYPYYMYAPELATINGNNPGSYSLNIFPSRLWDLPLVTDKENIKISTTAVMEYLNELFYRRTDVSGNLPNITKDYVLLYNNTIEEITDTSMLSNFQPNCIVLPALRKVAYSDMFASTSYNMVTEFIIGKDFKSNLNISHMISLPTINILDILYKLADVTNEEETYTLTLGTKLLSILSDDEKAIATNKGWVLA